MDRLLPDGTAPHYDDKQTRSMFTAAEDKKLLKLVEEAGKKPNWRAISIIMKTRTPRQCRERYQNYLNPSLDHENWTPDEDQLILEKFKEHGPKWNLIAKFFHGRTGNATRNRFQSLQRKLRKQEKLHKATTIEHTEQQANVPLPAIIPPPETPQTLQPSIIQPLQIPPFIPPQTQLPFPQPPPLRHKYQNFIHKTQPPDINELLQPQNLLSPSPKIIVKNADPKAYPPELQIHLLIHKKMIIPQLSAFLFRVFLVTLGFMNNCML